MRHRRTEFNDVRPGTNWYTMMRLLFRPRGLGSYEAKHRGLVTELANFGGVLMRLRDDFGYDIRIIDKVPGTHGKRRRCVYRIVARYNMNGTLMHDYISPEWED